MVTDLSTVRICKPLCAVKEFASNEAKTSSELLFGEPIQVLEQDNNWSKIRSITDGYQGFIENHAYHSTELPVTHWVSTRATFVFEMPDIKSSVVSRVLFGSQVSLKPCDTDELFMAVNDLGFIWSGHCRKINDALSDSLIDIAQEHYLNAPYLWGGRSTDGCDCSGLVQLLAAAKGFKIPRDSGDQERALSNDIDFDNRAGDNLVYWPGHVGILQTPDLLLHSTAHSLRCCVEPLQDVIRRAGEPSSVKRLG